MINLNDPRVVIIICLVATLISIITVITIIRGRKKREMKKALSVLEIEKNKLASSPIIPELAKVESFLNNEKLEVMYNEWSDRLKDIKDVQVPNLSNMLLEAEYSLKQKDYKSTIYKIAKLEMELYKVKTNSEFLLGEIKEITTSESKSRSAITKYRAEYRNLYEKFNSTKDAYGKFAGVIQAQFEVIAKRFEDFESIMDNNEFDEVGTIINIIDELLKHMNIVIDEVPSIVLLAYNVLPKRIEEVVTAYNQMVKEEYPLDYLNVEYNISEANAKIKDVIMRTKSLNLQDSLFELKVLLDYFDSLFVDFENEKRARKAYREKLESFSYRIDKMNQVVNEISSSMDEIKNIYNLSDDNIKLIKEVFKELDKININFKVLNDHTGNHTFAYSKLLNEIEGLSTNLTKSEEKLDSALNEIGTMRDDEVRARHQLEEIKMVLKESKNKMRDYNFPTVPNSYYVELKEASLAMNEIVKELSKKPITIDVLNTRVDTARDLVLKLYTKTTSLLKTARLAETAIVYGNRYRSSFNELNKQLNLSEQLFMQGEYHKSLNHTINILKAIEPSVYNKLNQLYNDNK